MGVFQVVQDWQRKHELKKQWLLALNKLRGPGHGIDLPVGDPVAARAAMELLERHPQLTVIRFKDSFQLTFKVDFAASITPDLHNRVEQTGFFARPGDALPEESVEKERQNQEERALVTREEK